MVQYNTHVAYLDGCGLAGTLDSEVTTGIAPGVTDDSSSLCTMLLADVLLSFTILERAKPLVRMRMIYRVNNYFLAHGSAGQLLCALNYSACACLAIAPTTDINANK